MHLFGIISYGAAFFAYLALSLLMVTSWRGRLQGALLTTACVVTFLWALGAAVASTINQTFAGSVVLQLLEWARQSAWLLFLWRLLKSGDTEQRQSYLQVTSIVAVGCGVLLLVLFISHGVLTTQQILNFRLISHLILAFIGLVLIEQMYRNLRPERVWAMKFLALGIGGMFVYEFYMYADGLLFRRVDGNLWDARGLINAMIMPMLAVSAARNPSWSLDIFVSRGVVFHGAAMLGASMYLLAMAAGGYYIRVYGGSWGGAVQAVFLFGAVLMLVSLLSSGQLRAKLRVFIDKHFFNYRYDYRHEWKRFIETLDVDGASAEKLRERALQAVAEIIGSPRAIFLGREGSQFQPKIYWNMDRELRPVIDKEDPLVQFVQASRWIVDLNEMERFPHRYQDIRVPDALQQQRWAWLMIPLFYERLYGFVLLGKPHAQRDLNWEDRDLLRIAAFQAANYLRLLDTTDALAQAKQFEAYHQLSAFVMHDLKNLVAQLSLVAANAQKHKTNPAFIDDAVATLEHSVKRMTRLLGQLQSGAPRVAQNRQLNLVPVLKRVVAEKQSVAPLPQLHCEQEHIDVIADETSLYSVFGHIIQNAQDATRPDGTVTVRLMRQAGKAVVDIDDSGAGMDAEFIKHRLFRPFDTTKGLTGMGIGAFEAKMYVQDLGGDLHVDSVPGKGTCFRIALPSVEIREL